MAVELRSRLRQARVDRAWSQERLARHSGTSRVTIARLEAGSDQSSRLATLQRLCEALGLQLLALPPRALETSETHRARAEERARRLERRYLHAVLATRLLAASPSEAAEMIAQARRRVNRWERQRLCSSHYISRWRARLKGGVERVARSLIARDEWTDALLQNSPWSFALESHG